MTLAASVNAPGWILDSMTITIDGTANAATLNGTYGSIVWDCSQAGNPSEHYVSATAQLHRDLPPPFGGRQTETLNSLDSPNPPPGGNSGNGRAADFIIANLKLKSLKFNSPITLLVEKNNPVPVPQMTWDQNGNMLTGHPFAYVRNTTPNFTFDLWNITGNATMGFVLGMADSTNTGDPDVTFYQPALVPEVFTSPATRAAQNPLLNKVVLYHNVITRIDFYVRFTLPGTWSNAMPGGQVNLYNTLYGVLATPTAPMSQPWVQILDDACNWALNATNATDATTGLTMQFYDHAWYRPDRNFGWDTLGTTPETFYLGDFLNGSTTTDPDYANIDSMHGQCNDFADFLVCLSNALGARPLQAQKSNNPADDNAGFDTNPVTLAPDYDGPAEPVPFRYHQFGNDNTIFDAAVRWAGENGYDTVTVADMTGPDKFTAYFYGTVDATKPYDWNPLTPFTPTIENHRP